MPLLHWADRPPPPTSTTHSSPAPAASPPTWPWPTSTTTPPRKTRSRSSTSTSTIRTSRPISYSSVPGFTEHLDSGAQVFSIINSYIVKIEPEHHRRPFGFCARRSTADNEQPFGPDSIPGGAAGTGSINVFGSNYFPGVSVYNVLGNYQPQGELARRSSTSAPTPRARRPIPASSRTGSRPRATRSGCWASTPSALARSYTYTQLNTIDKRTGTGTVATDDFSQMIQGFVTPGSSATGFYVSSFLQGDANRYYRSNQLGTYLQDKWQITPTLSLTAGVRYDWDGGLTEKYGRIFNFDAKPLQLQRRLRHHRELRPDHRRQQRQRHQGREQHHAHRPPVGHRPARRRCLAAGLLPQQGRRPHRRRHLLRPRRAVQLLLARLRHRHRHRRPLRRQPATSLRQRFNLPHVVAVALRVLHSHLRRKRRLRSADGPPTPRPAISRIPTARRCNTPRPPTPRPRI